MRKFGRKSTAGAKEIEKSSDGAGSGPSIPEARNNRNNFSGKARGRVMRK